MCIRAFICASVRNGEPGGTRTHDTRIKSPMLYQTELPAHNDIIKAFLRDKKLSGLAPTTLEFYHEKLAKLPQIPSINGGNIAQKRAVTKPVFTNNMLISYWAPRS